MRFIATSSYADGVSVIVPVRNGAPWLARVIEALLAEDPGERYEIIAIDDGSTDGSAAILARFNRDPRVRVIDGPKVVDAVPWLHIRATLDGQDIEGWASANFLKPE